MNASHIVESISNHIVSQYDSVIEKALIKCGFTMQFCEEHSHEFLWITDNLNPLNRQLFWQNTFLFAISETVCYDDAANKYLIKIEVTFKQ